MEQTHAVIRWTEEVTNTFSYDRKRVKTLPSRPKKGTAGFFLVGFKLTLQLYLLWIARIHGPHLARHLPRISVSTRSKRPVNTTLTHAEEHSVTQNRRQVTNNLERIVSRLHSAVVPPIPIPHRWSIRQVKNRRELLRTIEAAHRLAGRG
jgi:hypothetical protein